MYSTNTKPVLEQLDPPLSPRECLPTMDDLPSEDPEEPGLPDEFHDLQPHLLSRTLSLTGYSRDRIFRASDMNLYYDVNHPLWHKRPDWFLVVDVPRLYEQQRLRKSYVVWQEGVAPYIVVEFLSPGTEAEDLGRFYQALTRRSSAGAESDPADPSITQPPSKLIVYEQHLRVPHYVVYNRVNQQLRHFKLNGGHYQEQAIQSEAPMIWLDDLDIGLGIWLGEFDDIQEHWLRWCDRDGNWLLTDTEQEQQAIEQQRIAIEQQQIAIEQERAAKEQERAAKEQERAAKEQALAQLKQTAQNLLSGGMEISQVAQIMSMSVEEVEALLKNK
jgi:Uma2 family endonuclease